MKNNLEIKNRFFLSDKLKNVKKNNFVLDNIKNNLDNKNTFQFLSKKFKFNFKVSNLKKFKKYNTIVVLGIGGSILGAKAIYSFLKDKIKKNFIFIDDLDESLFKDLYKKNKKDLLFIIISKSGNTLETLVNINLLSSFNLNKTNTIIITEKKNNILNKFANTRNIFCVEHKNFIGGRYSVFSEVGMIPAYFMDLNIKSFRKNILKYFTKKNRKILLESTNQLSKYFLSKDISSIIFFNYSSKLNELALWCQQLIAESLGKKNKGILPILSKAPKDHHSLLQLYLDGPKDKIFYVLSEKVKPKKNIKNRFNNSLSYLSNKNLDQIIDSQRNAFLKALRGKKIPYKEILVNKCNEETIGEFFSYFILETAIIGKLINVNPFNQPAVEEVKILTKKNLN